MSTQSSTETGTEDVFVFPASLAQQRLWLLDQLEPGRATYNIPLNFRLSGPLDAQAMRAAFSYLVERQEVLRTTFDARDGEPQQVVHPAGDFALRLADLRGVADQDSAVARLVEEEGNRPFDLRTGPLLRATLAQLGDDQHVLLITVHHIAADGWSFGILLKELGAAYASLARGQEPALAELPIQYADYAIWQRERLTGNAFDAKLDYWTKQLAAPLPTLDIPTETVRDADRPRTAHRVPVRVSITASEGVKALAREVEVTPFVLLLAVFQILLRRSTGSEDIIVGSPIAGRTRVETDGLIGFFVNTLVLRTNAAGAPTVREFVTRVRDTVLSAMANQDVPFERIVEALQPERDRSRNPLFDALFSLQAGVSASDFAMPGLVVHKLAGARDTAKFDVQLILNDTTTGFRGALEYDADLFDELAMRRFAAHYAQLVGSAVAIPDSSIDLLPLMDEAERSATLTRGVGVIVPRDPAATVVSLVRAKIAKTPDAIAVELGPVSLTYAQLAERADAITQRLQANGVGRGDRVAICAERTINVVSAVLGVLSAGACYVPIDPAYPSARAAYMLEHSRARVLLASSAGAVRLPPHAKTLLLDDSRPERSEGPAPGPAEITPADLAYVLYTSGSTGVPKGVAMGHGAMVNLLEWQRTTSAATVGTRTLQFASLSFDVSFQEIFSTWCTGGTLVLVDEDTRRDPAALVRLLGWKKIERVFLPFIALEHLADTAAGIDVQLALREIITAGEQLRVTAAIRALAARLPGCELVNQYGPTESHVVTALTMRGDSAEWPALPSIGRPIDNVSTHVLDAMGEPVPDGLPGELYLGGLALAHGYLDDPARTAERFVGAPRGAAFDRLYRTGDLARVRSDGTLDYLGRADDQVKIRGFRVELGEIERVLSESTLVVACAVVLRGGSSTDKRLVAYCVLREGTEVSKTIPILQAWCRERLPEYMLPAGYVPLDALPLTPSGKVARRSLPDVDPVALDTREFKAPRTPLETEIAAVWADVLHVPRVGVDDNFFELGGHSLLATRMVSRVRDQSRRDVPLRVLFDHPALGAFVAAIEGMSSGVEGAPSGRIVARSRDATRRSPPPVRPP
jgi:amino acid adenylation domain-containing protein